MSRKGKRYNKDLILGKLRDIQMQLDNLEISEFDTYDNEVGKLIKKLRKQAKRLQQQVKYRENKVKGLKIKIKKLKNEDAYLVGMEKFIEKIKKTQNISNEEWDAAFPNKEALYNRLKEYYKEHNGTFYAASDGQNGTEDRNIIWRLDALENFAKTVPGYTGEFEEIYQHRLNRAVAASENVYSKIIPQGI